jgi:hypothetical protein
LHTGGEFGDLSDEQKLKVRYTPPNNDSAERTFAITKFVLHLFVGISWAGSAAVTSAK